MAHAPREIRRKSFTLTRRGFDTDEVEAYLNELADQIESLTASLKQNRYRRLGREVEAVLRTAHEQAARMRAEAKRAAKATTDDASLYGLERKREADRDRDEAKRLLVRHQERGASLVREAEEQAATIVRAAETLARSRATQVLAQAQQRLDRIEHEEAQVQQRLRTARSDLQAILARAGLDDREIIDLTSSVAADQNEPRGPGSTPGPPGDPFAIGHGDDAVAELVREAVSTAVEHASGQDRSPGASS